MLFRSPWSSTYPTLTVFSKRDFKGIAYGFMVIIWLFAVAGFVVNPQLASASDRAVLHHELELQILPETHEIVVRDTISIKPQDWPLIKNPLQVSLNRNLTIDEIRFGSEPASWRILDTPHDMSLAQPRTQVIELSNLNVSSSTGSVHLSFQYKGKIDDPPRSSKGLRFVSPNKTDGYVGPEGVYLTSETAWYPSIAETLDTFSAQVTLPQGWLSVTQGHESSQVSKEDRVTTQWDVQTPSEALTVVANRFIKQQAEWEGIEISTYFFPEDASLADQYLEATERYLHFYTTLLGPYPFRKFAVVENFFPSGIGLPSFTLLGSRIIKRGYTQPYSLGHEIVHSWFGNSVFNDFQKGNWVEGMTTYFANYYYEEIHGTSEHSLANRRRMFFEYSLYASPANEYPLIQFHHKETQLDNAIGYQKAAMVFHMLRRELGNQAFFSGIRSLVKGWSGSYADWDTLEQVFEDSSKRELHWFFKQWVEQSDAPSVSILNGHVRTQRQSDGDVNLLFTLIQHGPPFRLQLPLVVELANGQTHTTMIQLTSREQPVTLRVPSAPLRLELDPHYDVLRRLPREQIPPMLNAWVTDESRTLVLPPKPSVEEQAAYQPILDRLGSQKLKTIQGTDAGLPISPHSMLVLDATPGNQLAFQVIKNCPHDITVEADRVTIRDQVFEGPHIAWLVSCPHPTQPGRTITLFSGFSPLAMSRVARLLFFYGWDSYLVFDNGRVVTRGMFEPIHNDFAATLNAA